MDDYHRQQLRAAPQWPLSNGLQAELAAMGVAAGNDGTWHQVLSLAGSASTRLASGVKMQ